MQRNGIFADGLWSKIIVEGTMLGVITLVIFSLGNKYFGLDVGRTMAFATLGLIEMVHSFNIRSEESILNSGIFKNKYLWLAFIVGVIAQVGIILIPGIREIFSLVPLNLIQWGIVGIFSILPIIIIEMQKKLNETLFGKTVYNYKERYSE